MLADTGSAGGALVAVVPLRRIEPLNWDVRTHSLQGWLVEHNPGGQNVTWGPPYDSSGDRRGSPVPEACSQVATTGRAAGGERGAECGWNRRGAAKGKTK